MPNYCNNILEVSGDTAEMKAFIEKGLVEEYIEWSKSDDIVWKMSKYDTETKWDYSADSDSYDTDHETYFNCEFDTAWVPPCDWLAQVIKAYPNLEFKMFFMETGVGFCGVAYSLDGEMVREDGKPKRYSDRTGFEVHFDSEKDCYIDSQGTEIESDDVIEDNPFERR